MEVALPGPEQPRPPYGRTAHPFFLHDMIRSQPAAVRATAAAAERAADRVPAPPSDRPVLFVGMGTSFHAARAAAWAAGPAWGYRQSYRAVDAFDLLLEPVLVRRAGTAVVFSASGETALTHRAQEALREAGVPQVLITASEASRSASLADHVLVTQGATEKAWVHTVSYTTAIAAALALVHRWTGHAAVRSLGVDQALEKVVGREEEWRSLASGLGDRSKVLILGSGPDEATAREAALKLREGAARFAAAVGVEEFLHGTLPSVDADGTAVLAVATAELDRRRATTALSAAARAGAKVALFGRGKGEGTASPEFELPAVLPAAAPIVDIVPFQFLAYWLAVGEGRNPDVMGYDDPRIFAARCTYGI